MSLVIKQTRVVEVPVTTLSVAATCQQAMLIDAAGQCVGSTNAMPAFMPTLLEIDLATGAIKNWNVPTGEQLQAIADANVSPMRKALDLVESPSFFQDRIKPSLLTEQRMAELMLQSKQVEIDTFNASEIMPDTVAVLEKYATDMPSLADEQTDEPTDADTALCPDVPDSFYAAQTPCPMPETTKWGVFIDNGCGTRQAAPSFELATAYCDVLQKVRPDYVGIISVQKWPENEDHNPEWFDESYQSCLKDIEKMKDVASAEPVADPDDIKPVCTLKQKLDPLPTVVDNGELPSDFDDSDSAAKIEVTVTKRTSPESAPEYVARTGKASSYVRASSKFSVSNAIDNLLAKCKLSVARSAIVEITTDDDLAQNRQRFSIDTSFAEQPSDSDMANDEIAYSGETELPEPPATNPDQIDIEQAIAEALVRPEPVMDLSQPAPVDIVTELSLSPSHVMNQLIAVQQRQCDPIYSAFFAARGLTENGKLSSKGTRLLAGLSQAESNERAEQIIKNACEVPATDATYDEIVALINHASTQMQVLKLTDRISKHAHFAERQKLFAIQKDRIDALKADSAA